MLLQVTVNLLVELDKLTQLLESPIFTQLRLQLLEPQRYAYLIKALYGLLMLMPQVNDDAHDDSFPKPSLHQQRLIDVPLKTPAYHTLKERLSCVPTIFHALDRLERFVAPVFIVILVMSSSTHALIVA